MRVIPFAIATAADRSSELFSHVLPWVLVLIGVIIAGGVIIVTLRRRLGQDSAASSHGFTLHDLRSLHARGELTDEEFERAKAQMIGHLTAAKNAQKTRSKSEDADSPTGNSGQSSV